jgi:hypothetical protein
VLDVQLFLSRNISFTPNTPQGDGNFNIFVFTRGAIQIQSFTPNTPQGDGNRKRQETKTRRMRFKVSRLTPRKGTETKLQMELFSCVAEESFTPNTPQGDGNINAIPADGH